jgi:hypothetical protein
MTPDIKITVDEFKVMTLDVTLMGAKVETIKISSASVNALRDYFANEATDE